MNPHTNLEQCFYGTLPTMLMVQYTYASLSKKEENKEEYVSTYIYI